MKPNYLLSMVMLGTSAVACARAAPPPPTPTHELTVPNFDVDSPACVVRVPVLSPPCTSKGCTLPAPAGSSLDSIELRFSCLPDSAPTGFENPKPPVKVQTFRVKNSWVHLSLADDDLFETPTERFRHLGFCLYGKSNYFCGNAKVMRLGDRSKVDGTRTVKAFLQKIKLQDALTIDGR